jgi:tryptophan halogenase
MTAGVKHIEGTIANVRLNAENGCVEALELDGGRRINGDLYIDCSGFRGVLIEQALATGYEPWNQWLPCDRAVAMPCESRSAPNPYTASAAAKAGWQWRIPLQHRVGNGYVYCSRYASDDEAVETLRSTVEGPALAEPRVLPFTTGIRKKVWNKNVFCLGLASGFLEPLESTSIYLVQKGIAALIGSFPQAVPNRSLQEDVNRRHREHWEHIRDFIILHYKLNRREGEPFWDECRHMSIPDSLAETIDLYRATGRVRAVVTDFFKASSWLSMFSGFGILPEYYHPSVDDANEEELVRELENMAAGIAQAVADAPAHGAFVQANCAMPVSCARAAASS